MATLDQDISSGQFIGTGGCTTGLTPELPGRYSYKNENVRTRVRHVRGMGMSDCCELVRDPAVAMDGPVCCRSLLVCLQPVPHGWLCGCSVLERDARGENPNVDNRAGVPVSGGG